MRRLICLAGIVLLCISSRLACQDSGSSIVRLYNEAKIEEQNGRISNAIQKYQAILQIDPKVAAAYNNLGRLYLQQSQYADAIRVLKKAVQLDATLEPSHVLLGISWYVTGDFAAGSRELEEAVRLNPDDHNAKLYLAKCLYQLGKLIEASQVLNDLEHADPKNPQVLYTQGLVQLKLATSTFEQLEAVAPDSYLVELLLATAAAWKQDYFTAIEHYKKAILKAPDARGLHYELGHALYLDGQVKEALREYQLELQINPYDYMASGEAALVLVSTDPQKAIDYATRAIELKANLAPAYLIRGRALLGLNKLNGAVKDLKEAASLDPSEPTVHFQLGRAYGQLGLKDQAAKEYAIFQQMQAVEHGKNIKNSTADHLP
jgi:tetratricopeptide (TPR) repeat protein